MKLSASSLKKIQNYSKKPNLGHFLNMTTGIGFMQHGDGDKPDERFGYSIDDCARAILVTLEHDKIFKTNLFDQYGRVYLNYLLRARNSEGAYHNFADKKGKFIDEKGSLDSQGRMLWALGGVVASDSADSSLKRKIEQRIDQFKFYQEPFLRSQAFGLIGYSLAGRKAEAKHYADSIVKKFRAHSEPTWQWFEDGLTYSNAIIPLALLKASQLLDNHTYLEVARESFTFLNKVCYHDSYPAPIGCDGWFYKGKSKAIYDQQVVDVADMVLTANELYCLLHEENYLKVALEWMHWFEGRNVKRVMMVTPKGGVYDGITPYGVNTNQGAESVIMYLLSYLSMTKLARKIGRDRQ